MKTIITVCARGGSKGVKGKNVRDMNGLPLIAYTLRQARAFAGVDGFAVSSDSDAILAIAEKEGFLVVKRPDELATDTAAKIPVIRHCVETAEKILGKTFDLCIDLDCTSPLRDVADIEAVVKLLSNPEVPNVITAMPARRSPYFNLIEKSPEGRIQLAKKLDKPVVRRQDAPECFDMNASIYGWKREVLMKENTLFLPGTALHVMPEERSIDIDSELDFQIVEMIMKKRMNS